jgi:hypothetical protein
MQHSYRFSSRGQIGSEGRLLCELLLRKVLGGTGFKPVRTIILYMFYGWDIGPWATVLKRSRLKGEPLRTNFGA